MGRHAYPQAQRLLISADAGGSKGYRLRAWKWELQRLADETGLRVEVCHLPPGTSKWNKIEHRLFASISYNWRGQPLLTYATVVQLIGATRTRTGLTVHSEFDPDRYPTGIKISDAQMAHINRVVPSIVFCYN